MYQSAGKGSHETVERQNGGSPKGAQPRVKAFARVLAQSCALLLIQTRALACLAWDAVCSLCCTLHGQGPQSAPVPSPRKSHVLQKSHTRHITLCSLKGVRDIRHLLPRPIEAVLLSSRLPICDH